MFVAQQLRKNNIAQFLIYMWQVEDLLRAFDLDTDRLKQHYIARFDQWTEEQKAEALEWYQDIANMMRSEGITKKGHLQICKNVIINLTDLHNNLMASHKFQHYHSVYSNALPLIVELRSKQPDADQHNELESCFELIYGLMMLKMKKQEISTQTAEASKTISTFIGLLSDYYHQNISQPIEF
ncbi:MAG: DUF4924 family protein [Prevotellaceae bacterium]|nr:DUF4924 family protein [Prevotellaceae bacterium]